MVNTSFFDVFLKMILICTSDYILNEQFPTFTNFICSLEMDLLRVHETLNSNTYSIDTMISHY